jgi:hypothetical protein
LWWLIHGRFVSQNGTDVAENHTRKDSVGSTWRATSLVGILGKIDVRERERERERVRSFIAQVNTEIGWTV